MITFLTTAGSLLGVNALTQIFKSVMSKLGDTGTHLLVLAICIVCSVVYAVLQGNPSYMEVAKNAVGLLMGSIATYEIVWKQISSIVSPVSTS